ncbi:MAG: hypothetical protein K5988_08855 [Lachnospiraceae bacterium]|nr:hypothetical protein [Lachnospiraceae bacterium]
MEDNAKTLKKLYIGQIVNRILLILGMIILIANLVGTIIMAVEIKRFTVMIEPAIEAINAIDVEELNKTLVTINNAVDVFKIDESLEAISKLDFEGFSKVINGIDVDKLNSTLEKIDEASNFMKRIGDGMNTFLNQFGINMGK